MREFTQKDNALVAQLDTRPTERADKFGRSGVERQLAELKVARSSRAERTSYFNFMYTVYVLQDENGKMYKGMTNNLQRRLSEHRSGKTKTTKLMQNIVIVYQEQFQTREEARKREVYFKTAAGRKFLKKQRNIL